ncbi:hypothetical protein OBBRIDRAFT_838523 [Obba rivulosa]|uniref:Uncharacterized protein n=1 Tax=Obba rivulosa TaxID=1052685 RepID=A0A8E2AJZ7_9APHY|nr:hypothetical protein OBBRIDRAFT_838523 [Obba rivulosa]
MSDPPPNSPSLLALLYASDEDHQVLLHRLGLLPSSVQDTGTEQHTIENTPYQTPPAYYAGVQYEAQSPMGLFPAEHMLPPQPLPFSQPAPFMGAGGVLAGGHPEPGLVQDNISAPKTFASSTGVAKSYRVPNGTWRYSYSPEQTLTLFLQQRVGNSEARLASPWLPHPHWLQT